MKYKVFVDGQHGTTGLRVNEYLEKHPNVEMIQIDFEQRRDQAVRIKCLNEADFVILCLPEAGSEEAVSLITNPNTKVIDASTAFRTNDDWAYGLPELSIEQKAKITTSKRVSVPGCHASATILAIAPLVKAGIIPSDYPLTIHSITGYSGGGKQMIHDYEEENIKGYELPRPYALGLKHKHLPEMKKFIGLDRNPAFVPIVSDFLKGLGVSIPLHQHLLKEGTTLATIHSALSAYYENQTFVKVIPLADTSKLLEGTFIVNGCNETNIAEIFVLGNDETPLVMCRLDNLGKGASGAAIQNLNIMMGVDETTCL